MRYVTRIISFFFLFSVFMIAAPAWANHPVELVKDINVTGPTGKHGSDPQQIINISGMSYFNASDGVHGTELWKSDGTEAGTVMVKDIAVGYASSSPGLFTEVNGVLYFVAKDGVNGSELWKSDGTAAGTVMVKNICPSTCDSSPHRLSNVNGTLFFVAFDEIVHGTELWKSDGTEAGTVMVKDIRPGSLSSSAMNLTNVNGVLYFNANDGVNGHELWKSDGTEAGTVMVKDINTGAFDSLSQESSINKFINMAGVLYFNANDGVNGYELWKSDGTEAGTVMVKDINAGINSSGCKYFTDLNGVLYFSANDGVNGAELWKSDGTEAGTVMVRDIFTGVIGSSPASITSANGMLFFVANDGVNGAELWRSTGNTFGTSMVKDIRPGSMSSSAMHLTNVNDILYFSADDGVNGYELWRTIGSPNSTIMLKDIYGGGGSSMINSLTNINGVLYFNANDGVNGYELWKSDGSASTTVMVKDIEIRSNNSIDSNSYLTKSNAKLYFSADDGVNGRELWSSDGSVAGTILVKDINVGIGDSYPLYLTDVNSVLYFTASDGVSGHELWKSDGTDAGTVMVKDINVGIGGALISSLINVNGILFFTANDGTNGYELWKSDGTDAGTIMVKDINVGAGSYAPNNLINVNGVLYFRAYNGVNGVELWKSDGTATGTVMVKDINPGAGYSDPNNLIDVNGILYFSANDGTNGFELWKSDGTAAGTVMVKDIYAGSNLSSSAPHYLTNINGVLYFAANDGVSGDELWKSDGTEVGTLMIKDINIGVNSSIPNSSSRIRNLTSVNGVLYFIANDGLGTLDALWESDGTEAGTVKVNGLYVDTEFGSTWIDFLTNLNGALYFKAYDGVYGAELWNIGINGIPDLIDINPGGYSNPSNFTELGGRTFFFADNGVNGRELWATSPSVSINSVVVTETDSGTSNLVFTVKLPEALVTSFTVDYATSDNSAISGSDYATTIGTLTFSPGVTEQTVSVPIIGDTVYEYEESFYLTLSNPSEHFLPGMAKGTIVDTDSPVPPSIDPGGPYTGVEGQTVNLVGSATSVQGVIVSYEWDPGDGSGIVAGTTLTHTYADNGVYTVTFTAVDSMDFSNSATVGVTVSNANPVAVDDSVSVDEDMSVITLNVLLNDTDVPADQSSLSIASADTLSANGGSVVDNGDGSFTYMPVLDFNGIDIFSYTVLDKNGGSDIGAVTITVNPVNDAPFSVPQQLHTVIDTPLAIALGGIDPDGDIGLTYTVVSPPANGTLSGTPPNLTYTPDSGYTGNDTFLFKSNDGSLDSHNTAAISISVGAATVPSNSPPTISGAPPTTATAGVAYSFTPVASEADVGDTLIFLIANQPVWSNFDTSTGTLTGTPSNANAGTTTGVTIYVTDGKATVSLAPFDLTVTADLLTNNAPTAPLLISPFNGATDIDTASVAFEWENANDQDGDVVSYQIIYCTDVSFIGCIPVTVAGYQQTGMVLAGLGGASSLMVFGLIGFSTSRRQGVVQIGLVLLILALTACSDKGGTTVIQQITAGTETSSHSVTGLTAGTTYYWKVTASDGKGGTTDSVVWSLTTAP